METAGCRLLGQPGSWDGQGHLDRGAPGGTMERRDQLHASRSARECGRLPAGASRRGAHVGRGYMAPRSGVVIGRYPRDGSTTVALSLSSARVVDSMAV